MSKQSVRVVTGGAQGIGKAIALKYLGRGDRVIIGDKDTDALAETREELDQAGPVTGLRLDVSDIGSIQEFFREVSGAVGSIDSLVNNAGGMRVKPIEEWSWEEWTSDLHTNLSAVFFCTQQAAPLLRACSDSPAVVNIASTRAIMSEPDTFSYSAAKGGILALTHSLAVSLGPGIRVNSISPGWIDVSGWKAGSRNTGGEMLAEIDHRQHPSGRVGRPEDVAAACEFLTSGAAEFVTGANFVIDGGMTRKMIYAE